MPLNIDAFLAEVFTTDAGNGNSPKCIRWRTGRKLATCVWRQRSAPPTACRRLSNSRRLHRPHAVPGSAKSQRCRRPLDQTERGQTVSISHRAARWSPHDMLRLELMVVFAWRFARTTVAAYVVNMARRIPHVLSCQMTQVEPSER